MNRGDHLAEGRGRRLWVGFDRRIQAKLYVLQYQPGRFTGLAERNGWVGSDSVAHLTFLHSAHGKPCLLAVDGHPDAEAGK